MPKEEWGVKRVCPKTGKRFYDLNKSPIISPYTGEVVELETPNASGAKARAAEKVKAKAVTEDEDTAVVDDGDAVLEDDASDVEIDDDLLDDEDEAETVDLEEIADVPAEDDES